ncbi:MAG: hypothetical protein ACOWWH_00870 [Eubacteriaceae bacterium]
MERIICDDLVKYQCKVCNKQFIVSHFQTLDIENQEKRNCNLICPFCKSTSECIVGPVTSETDYDFLANYWGCLGIYTKRNK